MKKYVKPELFYENFELTQQIAACQYDHDNTNTDEHNCRFSGEHEDFGTITFFASQPTCEITPEYYCYHGNVGGVSIFNS